MPERGDDKAPDTAPDIALSRRAFVAATVVLGAAAATGETARAADKSGANKINATNAKATNAKATNAKAGGAMAMKAAKMPVANRAPLLATPFVALPLGSVEARGWLLEQLRLQRDGLTGHAEEFLPAVQQSAWRDGQGEDWEKGPYYLKGLVPLAYTLDDAELKAKVKSWVEPILASQRDDGFFGPTQNDDWWPRMVVTYLLRDHAEASGDARVAPFLTRYYRHMSDNVTARPLQVWATARAGDEIDTILWLYNRTGDAFLLELADTLHAQMIHWADIFTDNTFAEQGWMVQHNVNVPQAMKLAPVYYQRSKKARDRDAYQVGEANLNRDHGSSFGINNGAEKLSGRSPGAGVETCSIVEKMLSGETALRILGDASIGDNLETLAFNALPAALSSNVHQHVYYTTANHVNAVTGRYGFDDDHGDDMAPAPRAGFPCCCYNLHMGWPKLAQNSWAATSDGGLAMLVNLPSRVTAPVAGGRVATLECATNYPFEETLILTLNVDAPATFPLKLRVPGWCEKAEIKVNGQAQPQARAGAFATVNRQWRSGDRVEMRLPMAVKVARGVANSASVTRGPLLFALGLNENWQKIDDPKREGALGFDSYQVTSDSPWNWALELNEIDAARSFSVRKETVGANPFATGKAPVSLQVAARRVESWRMRHSAIEACDPPQSPVAAGGAAEAIALVPFGSQMLRITDFPVVGTPAQAAATMPRVFEDNFDDGFIDGWVIYGGNWYDRGGALRLPTQRGAGMIVAPGAKFADFVMDAQITPPVNGDVGLALRVNDPGMLLDEYQGYYVGLRAFDDQVVIGRSDFSWVPLQFAPVELTPGEPYQVRIEARGPLLRAWIGTEAPLDGAKPTLEVRDDRYASGAIGARCYDADKGKDKAGIANLRVRAL